MKQVRYLKFISSIIILIFLVSISLDSVSQAKRNYVNKWKKIPGKPIVIYLDTKTSLSKLLLRLPTEHLSDSGTTKCMYSVAAHGKKAINPLLLLFKRDSSWTTRVTVIETLYLIMIANATCQRPWLSKFKLVEPLAKRALISLLYFDGYEEQIVGAVNRYCDKMDLNLFKKILEERSIESLKFYDMLYFLFYRFHSNSDRMEFMVPQVYRCCYAVDGSMISHEYNQILEWIESGKVLRISNQIKSNLDWKLLSLNGVYTESEVLKRYLNRNYNCSNSHVELQGIFICKSKNELQVFGTIGAREIWISTLENAQ